MNFASGEDSPLLTSSLNSNPRDRVRTRSIPLSDITVSSFSQTISIAPEPVYRRWSVGITSTLILSIGGLVVGYGLGFSSPAHSELVVNHKLLDEASFPWFSSLYNLGAAIGSLLTLGTLNSLGRKMSLYLSLCLFQIGWLLIALVPRSPNIAVALIAGRIISGIGMGICTTVTPTYLAEISPPKYRGFFCSFFQLFIASGILLVYIIGVAFEYISESGALNIEIGESNITMGFANYVYLALIVLFIITTQSILLLLIYPSPYWLLSMGMYVKAKRVFSHYWGFSEETNIEVSQVAGRVKYIGANSLKTLLLPEVFVPCLLGSGVMLFQQFTGINALVFYQSTILEDSLVQYELNGNVAALAPALVQLVFTLIASLFVDKFGRKVLLILANIGMGLSMAVLGIYAVLVNPWNFYANCTVPDSVIVSPSGCQVLGWTAIISVCGFNAFFAIGWGPVPWIVVAEITNARWKNLTMGVIVFVSWFSAFIVTLTFPYYSNLVHNYGAFFTFFIFNILSILFVLVFLPETRKKSLLEIENLFGAGRSYPFLRF